MTFQQWLSLGVWLAAATNVLLLAVGLQLPVRYRWRSQFRELDSFTGKVVWGYASFVAMTLVAFGAITAVLHDEMISRERSAAVVAAFMAVWWTVRIGFDVFSYGHQGWPRGARFVLAHGLLLTGFLGMAVVYWTVFARAF